MNRIKCKEAGLLIGLLDEELNEVEAGLLRDHLAECPSCSMERIKILNARKLAVTSLHTRIPVAPEINFSRPARRLNSLPLAIWRISAAAAVLLTLLFLGEQTLAVRKIRNMEKWVGTAAMTAPASLPDRMALATAAFGEAGWLSPSIDRRLFPEPLKPGDMRVIRSTLRTRILTEEADRGSSFRTSVRISMIISQFNQFNYLVK